jgi:hypothetical protein
MGTEISDKIQLKSINQVIKTIEKLSKNILFSTDKTKITNSFNIIGCIIKGNCICDLCDTWDKNTFVVFEFGRCLIPSHFLQLVKATHFRTERWLWIKPLYDELYKTLFEDILPDTTDIASIEQESLTMCKYKLSAETIKKSIDIIKNNKKKPISRLTKKHN